MAKPSRYTDLRRKTGDVVALHLGGRELPRPIVDLGGAGKHDWMCGLLNSPDVLTWDCAEGPDVDRPMDAQHMPDVPDGYVGTLVSVATLEHVRRPWDAAREMGRVLRPGGLLFVMTVFAHPYHPAAARDRVLTDPEPALLDLWRFSVDGLRELFGRECREKAAGYIPAERAIGVWWFGERR